MPADIVPIELKFDERNLFTLWAPRWRDAGDEWEAFLGKDEDLYGFESVADLVAFVRKNTDNDLADHPSWETLASASADKLDPDDDHRFDLIGVYESLAEDPTAKSVASLHGTLAIVAAIGSVCELAAITKFFNGNPVLGELSAGVENFTGKPGSRRWEEIGTVVDKGWDKIIDAVEGVISTPEVDSEVSGQAEAELEEAREKAKEKAEVEASAEADDEDATDEDAETDEADEPDEPDEAEDEEAQQAEEEEKEAAPTDDTVLGADEDFWLKVGIDPVRMITSAGTFYTLRCYLDDAPIFLGRNGRVSVFSSGGALARYLADEHDHDLSDLSTYEDIRTAATDGSLRVDVTDDNVYVLTGLADDIAEGPETVEREQLELVVELLRDVGEYSEDDTVEETLDIDTTLGKFVAHVLDPDSVRKPAGPYAKAVEQFEELETFLDSRLRRE